MIEHKVNLLVVLFTFRNSETLSISEVIIMAKTAINSMSRVFPEAPLFSSHIV